jgi:hypothetical protein
MRHLMAVTFVSLFIVACGSKQTPEPAPVTPEPEPEPQAEIILQAPLLFEGADGTQLMVPMVEAGVRDGRARFIVDSAIPTHALTVAFAGRVRAPVKADRKISQQHSGVEVEASPVQGVVAWQFPDREMRYENVVAIQGSDGFEEYGIGGQLAPQLLTEKGAIVIDMPGNTLRVVEGPTDKVSAWLESEYSGIEDLTGFFGEDGKPYAEVTVGENEPVFALLDTGGEISEFESAYLADSPADVERPDPETMKETKQDMELSDQAIRLGSAQFSPSTVDLRGQMPDVDDREVAGVLGADLLKGCTLVLWPAEGRIAAACQ